MSLIYFYPFLYISLFSSSLSLSHLFSSVSVITPICFLHLPTLSLPRVHSLSSSLPPSLLSQGGYCCRLSFPNLLILSFFISSPLTPQCMHTHAHTHTSFHVPIHPLSLSSLPVPLWHKCICSIPLANRLAGCYQRQGDGDNGFHHIFSLPQIKMGQVIRRTNTHTFMVNHKHIHSPVQHPLSSQKF